MRHLKSGRALGVSPSHRLAMMRNMVTSLLEHQQVRTTMARAKEVRRPLAKMITLGKRGDLTARRKALAFVKSKTAMANLFGDFAERYASRAGGFVRIMPLGPRRGDAAEMAVIVLVDSPKDPYASEGKPRRAARPRREGRVIEQVAEEVKAQPASPEAEAGQPVTDVPASEAAPVVVATSEDEPAPK